MLNLYFGNLFSILTLVLVAGLLAFIAITLKKRNSINRWGKLILIFLILGTAVSAFSGIRDAFAAEGAIFAIDSMQAIICSVAGGLIFLLALLSAFFKNQKVKMAFFYSIATLFTLKVIVIESSRIVLFINGAI